MAPRKESPASETMVTPPPERPKDCKNHSTTLMAKIRVPAFTRKPRTFSHTCIRQFFAVGSR